MTTPRSSSRVDFIASGSGVAPDLTTNLPEDEIKPLSGNPYYHVVLSKSHVHHHYCMALSNSLVLPSADVPTVLNCGGKSWHMIYRGLGKSRNKFFDYGGWKNFADDNCLEEGDACIFELMENSQEKLVFEVQILRGDIPEIFLERETIGKSAEKPLVID